MVFDTIKRIWVTFLMAMALTAASAMAVDLPIGIDVAGTMPLGGTVIYDMETATSGQISLIINGWRATYNWGMDYDRLYVYNTAGEYTAREQLSSEEDPFISHMIDNPDTIRVNVGSAGTYHVHLHSGENYSWGEGITSQNYTIKAMFTPTADPQEPNETLETAYPIELVTEYNAYQWKPTTRGDVHKDYDTYRITLPGPGKMTVQWSDWESIFNWSAAYDRLFVYTADGTMFDVNGDETYYKHMINVDDGVEINVSQGGTYYIQFYAGDAYKLDPYSFSVQFTQTPDAFEPNDTLETAMSVSFDTEYNAWQWKSEQQGPYVAYDEDFYALDLPSPGKITLHLANWSSIYNWGLNYDRLYMYTTDGVMFNSSGAEEYYAHMFGDDETIEIPVASGGQYYVQFHAGNAVQLTPYTFSFTFEGIDDPCEPNDVRNDAFEPQSGQEYSLYQWNSAAQGPIATKDEDWFRLNVTEEGDVAITITGWQSLYNWSTDYDRMWIYKVNPESDPDLQEVYYESMLGDEFDYTFTATPGTYYIQLHSGNKTSSTPYILTVDYPGAPVAVEEETPETFSVTGAYPNPFNPVTTIGYSLPETSRVTLTVYDTLGRQVRTIDCGSINAGSHTVTWNGRDDAGRPVASGSYIYRLDAGAYISSGKMMLVR